MQKNIIKVALAVFSLSFMLLFANNIPYASAFEIINRDTTNANTAIDFVTVSTGSFYVIKDSVSSPYRTIQLVSATSPYTLSTVNLPNILQAGKTYGFGISCVDGVCFVAEDGTGASNDRVIQFNPTTGTVIQNSTLSSLATGMSNLEGSGQGISMRDGYLLGTCTVATGKILISQIGERIGTCGGTTLGSGVSVFGWITAGTNMGVLTDSLFQIWDLTASPPTRTCTVAETSGQGLFTDGTAWYAITGTNTIDKITSSCTKTAGFITGTGITDQMRMILFDPDNDSVYITSDSKTAVMNYTSSQYSTLMYTIALGSTITSKDKQTVLADGFNSFGILHGGTVDIIQIADVPSGGGGSTGGIDCTDPDFSYRLICNLSGNSGLTGASNLINQSGTNIVCQIGLLQCTQGSDGNFTPTNGDIQTNGVGYLLLAILIAIWVGIMWVASRGQLTEIPTFIWFIGIIAIVGVVTAFGWINPTFLIIAVVAVAGFAVAKARGVFGGQIFAGESS